MTTTEENVIKGGTESGEEMLLESWQDLDGREWNETFLKELVSNVEEYEPLKDMGVSRDKIPHVNILLLGRIASGKSSFFNTIDSVIKGRLSVRARAGCADTSLTKSLDVYKVKIRSRTEPLNFRLIDCRGLEDNQSVISRDVEAILDGHMKDGYFFNQSNHIAKDNPKYRKDPTLADSVHCVVFVVDGSSPPDMILSEKMQSQVQELQDAMNRRKIPQLVLLTKVDTISSPLKTNLSRIFYSQKVLDMRNAVATAFGLPPYSVLPMQNLASNPTVTMDIKILTLFNLRQILRAADDFLENFEDDLMPDKIEFPKKGYHNTNID